MEEERFVNRSGIAGHIRRVVPAPALRYIGRTLDIRDTAKRVYGTPWLPLQRRAAQLHREHGWTLAESLHAGLLDPQTHLDPEALVAPRRLSEAQESLNAVRIEAVGEHKTIFRMVTAAAGIPTPHTHATFMRAASGWSWHTGSPIPPDCWGLALEALPDEFILKPAEGYYGEGVRLIRRDGIGWMSVGEGRRMTTEDLVRTMRERPEFGDWIAQERLRNHADLAPLGGEGLHTLRLVVVIRADGTPELVWSGFRIAVGEAVVDNFRGGTLGNLSCEVDLEAGAIAKAFRGRGVEPGMELVEVHPSAGIPLRGYRLPLWDEAVQTALDAAPAFLPLRTLGFDVGLTPDGPKVVEMNMWWDLPYNFDARALVARLWRESAAPTSPVGQAPGADPANDAVCAEALGG